ncbi:MAG: Na+/H+ antiporter NhaA [Bacteroidales bacterium]
MATFYTKTSPGEKKIVDKIFQPFEQFFKAEASSGILLVVASILAIILANSPLSDAYFSFWNTHIKIGYSKVQLDKPVILWINDGLMAIFFFFVGLEIKREIMVGELSSLKTASFPIMAALGGMLVPALLYASFNLGNPAGIRGWGIPMATDIAFALGILMLIGKRVPLSLKIFLTALAIADDLGAVLVIAFFYSSDINLIYLAFGAIIFILLMAANGIGIRHPLPFIILGLALWVAFLKLGVHTTVAGVLLAITIPSGTKINATEFIRKMNFFMHRFKKSCRPENDLVENQTQQEILQTIEVTCHQAESPMQRIEHNLRPWVIFFIMPLFAFANAGLKFDFFMGDPVINSVSLGIIAGLVIGKPLGILLFSWLGVKLKMTSLPPDTTWKHITGAGFLAGIGFTMSLFINSLAFAGDPLSKIAKLGIFTASIVAGILGWFILRQASGAKKPKKAEYESL